MRIGSSFSLSTLALGVATACAAWALPTMATWGAEEPAKKSENPKPTAAKPSTAQPSTAKPTAAGLEFFEAKIRPVLVAKCYECHSADSKELKGNLAVDTRNGLLKGGDSGAAVVPGNVKASVLIEAIRREGSEMPPDETLSASVIADFEKWIEMGAPDPRDGKANVRKIDLVEGRKHWAFQPVGKPTPPKVADAAWPKSEIDRFLLAALEAKDLKPVADADPVTWLRRVSLDLVGLQPTPAEIDSFVAAVAADREKAYAAVVDRLLASPHFGERWGRHWLDVARYAESTGKERNILFPTAFRYRDYVIDSLNADMPYDRFITEQVAGDLLPAETPEERNRLRVATGFLALGPKGINGRDQELFRLDTADDQIDVVGRAVMATTISCARCHDHKFDPIPQTDYYALAGIFRSTETMAGVRLRTNAYVGDLMLPLEPTSTSAQSAVEVASNEGSKKKSAANDERQKMQARLTSIENELLTLRNQRKKLKDRSKKAAELRANIAQLVSERDELASALSTTTTGTTTTGTKPNPKKPGKNGDGKPVNFDLVAIGVREEKPTDVAVRIRGEVDQLGPVVPRGFLSVLKSPTTPKLNDKQSGRLELAHWLTQKENPLTARVLANRIWFHLFGTGLVETVDNFGVLGKTPTNPELLDYLAGYVMDHGWSVKQTIRAVVLSRAYQLSSDHNDANYAVDPGNTLVWRMNRRRLDAEVIRDTALAASGTLALDRPAPAIDPKENGEIGRNVRGGGQRGPDPHRSVYLPARRGLTNEMLDLFDAADSNLVVGQRDVTTVATQALFMLNSPFVLEQADATAERLRREAASAGLDERVALLYRWILARPATDREIARGVEFVRESATDAVNDSAAWSALAQVLFSSAEFRYAY
jgi:cytochrome c553